MQLGDLGALIALVDQAQGLVVQVGVQVALNREILDDALACPRRPVVRREHHIGTVAERVDGLGEVLRPDVRVPHERAAQREQVVQRVGGVLGHAQSTELREVEVHLRRRLGARSHLELDLHAVDDVRLTRRRHVRRRHDEAPPRRWTRSARAPRRPDPVDLVRAPLRTCTPRVATSRCPRRRSRRPRARRIPRGR